MGFSSRSSTIVPSHEDRLRSRRRRQTLTFAGLFTVVLLVAVGALGSWLQWWTIGSPTHTRVACPVQTVSPPGATPVHVLNASERHGLAKAVAGELRRRGFRVLDVGNASGSSKVSQPVLVRFGAGDEVRARTVARQFPGTVRLAPEKQARPGHAVDVVIGTKYKAMVERAKAAAAIEPAPEPRGCVTRAEPAAPATSAAPATP